MKERDIHCKLSLVLLLCGDILKQLLSSRQLWAIIMLWISLYDYPVWRQVLLCLLICISFFSGTCTYQRYQITSVNQLYNMQSSTSESGITPLLNKLFEMLNLCYEDSLSLLSNALYSSNLTIQVMISIELQSGMILDASESERWLYLHISHIYMFCIFVFCTLCILLMEVCNYFGRLYILYYFCRHVEINMKNSNMCRVCRVCILQYAESGTAIFCILCILCFTYSVRFSFACSVSNLQIKMQIKMQNM